LTAGAILLGLATLIRARQEYRAGGKPAPVVASDNREAAQSVPRERVVAKPTDVKTQGAILHDVTLLGMIQNAKVASIQGDAVTRKAMLDGLKKEPTRARELIQKKITSALSEEETVALTGLLKELP
jgi:hypothetical protein